MAEFDYFKAYTRKDGTKYYRNNYELIFLFFYKLWFKNGFI